MLLSFYIILSTEGIESLCSDILSENGHFLKGHILRSEKKVLLNMSGYDPDKQEPSSFYDFLRFITFFKIELNKFQTEIQITYIIQCVTFYDSGPPSFGPDDFLQKWKKLIGLIFL